MEKGACVAFTPVPALRLVNPLSRVILFPAQARFHGEQLPIPLHNFTDVICSLIRY